MSEEPFRRHIVMLVDEIGSVVPRRLPSSFVDFSGREWTAGINDFDFGVYPLNRSVEIFVSFEKRFSLLFVPDTDVFQTKRLRMSKFRAYSPPCCRGIAVGEFNQIKGVVDPRLQLLDRCDQLMM